MGLLKTATGTLGSTGNKTAYVSTTGTPDKVYFSVVPPDGGTAIASGCVGYGDASSEWVSSYGRDGTSSVTIDRTDRCIHIVDQEEDGTNTVIFSVSFDGFDTSLSAYGLIGLKFDVDVANGSYSFLARLED